ncbi:MAG: hypothetical protein V2B19_31495 [Pseudomonadota bacterium]
MHNATDLSEHTPLTGIDEYPIHQFPEPIRIVASSDPRVFERYWFTAADDKGEVYLVTGLGFYPNLGTADAHAILVHDNVHTTVRAHRLLGDDRTDISVGPIRAEIIEPFREWRLTLGDNPQGLRFDLRWRDTKRAQFQRLMGQFFPTNMNGRLSQDWAGYETFGTIEGTIEYQGKQFELKPSRFRGSRDHHWGNRDGVGGPGHMLEHSRTTHLGQWVEFGDWSIWGVRVLYNLGDRRPRFDKIIPVDHKLRFDPVNKHLIGGVIRNMLAETKEIREVTYEQIGNQVAYLRCGMYDGPTGGTPEENYYHGTYVGDGVVGGETYDLTDPRVRAHIAGFEDHLCKATCNGETVVGILECKNPILYEMCRDGFPGFSLLEE